MLMPGLGCSKRLPIAVVGVGRGVGGGVCDSNIQSYCFARVLILMHRATMDKDIRRLVLTI